MQPFTTLKAIAAPLPIANVDTDKILPGRFLKTVTRDGLGEKLFWALRQDSSFVLNREPWANAGILIALDNFGSGSSREHAPWALLDFGIRCIIAPRFADIFYGNCLKNGMLPIVLPLAIVEDFLALAAAPATARFSIDLGDQYVATSDGTRTPFEIDPEHRAMLLTGEDEIGRSLRQTAAIERFQAAYDARYPWTCPVPLDCAQTHRTSS